MPSVLAKAQELQDLWINEQTLGELEQRIGI